MEPLFQFNGGDIDIVLVNAKRRLMMHDEYTQVACVERISNLLRCGGAVSREAVLSKLIKFDVLSTIFEIFQSSSDRLLPCVLDFLSLVIDHGKFYESHVATDAMDSILKVTVCTIKSRCQEKGLLEKLISTVYEILQRAVEFKADFDSVCVPRQMLIILNSLIVENSSDQKIQFSAIEILIIVLENIDANVDLDDGVFELCLKALNVMKKIVDYSDDEVSIARATDALWAICASGTRLCMPETNEPGMLCKVLRTRDTLASSIRGTAMSSLVSYVQHSAESNETGGVKFHRSLVTCLNNLYKLSSSYDRDNLSNHLTANGYLKYFLHSSVGLPENLRRSTCVLLSRIVATLSVKYASIGDGSEEETSIESQIHRGLLELPRDPEQWPDVLARCPGNSSAALMTLIYFHFLGTRENDMIWLRSLIARIVNLPKSQRTPTRVLKVLWFLFAAGYVSHPSPHMEQDYGRAVKRLASALQYSSLNDCYTHHIDLLHYCLKCAEFPRDLRNRAMDLWLLESDGDIKPLLSLDCARVVQHYLLLVIQTGYSEKIIQLAMKGIRDMMRADNAREISEIAWHMLPHLLSSYQPSKDEQVKAVLELTNISIPDGLPTSVRIRCADGLLNIILERESGAKLRTLAIMQSYTLLVTSATIRPFTILEKYCTTPRLLEELLLQAFTTETPELSAACLKLLAFIVHCRSKSSFHRRDKPVTIDVQSLADLLLNTRRSVRSSINGMQLALELLTQNIDGSPVCLDLAASERMEGVINLYETLHIVHGTSTPTQRDLVYQCLEGVLEYCRKHAEFLVDHLCSSMSNLDIVSNGLRARLVSSHFLQFLSIWLRYRKRYCIYEAPWCDRSLCKTPFEETLNEIRTYVDAAKISRNDAPFHNLQYAVSKLDPSILIVRNNFPDFAQPIL